MRVSLTVLLAVVLCRVGLVLTASLSLMQLVILLLWVFILATIISFFKINRTAALLLIPYLAWVSLALYLNYAIFILNP